MGPFAGLRVVDLCTALTPVAPMLLGDMGADVVKVEPPDGSHFNRVRNVAVNSGAIDSTVFLSVERNKRSLALDWKTTEGREVLLKLLASADVVVENMGPGRADSYGIGYEMLTKSNPRVIYCAVSAFGTKGPYASKKGLDLLFQALAGHMAITGPLGGEPVKCGPPVGDFAGVYLAAFAIAAALYARERDGIGQKIDVALYDGALFALMPREQEFWIAGRSTAPRGSRHVSVSPHQTFRTKDDRHIAVMATTQAQFATLCTAVGQPQMAEDPRYDSIVGRHHHQDELTDELEAIFATRESREWAAALDAAGVMSGLVQTTEEALTDEQAFENEMVVEVEHLHGGPIKVLGVPVKLARTPGSVRTAPPVLGQHTEEVLRELALSPAEIEELRAVGAI